MQEVTIKFTDEQARRVYHFLKTLYNRDNRTTLSKLCKIAVLREVAIQAEIELAEAEAKLREEPPLSVKIRQGFFNKHELVGLLLGSQPLEAEESEAIMEALAIEEHPGLEFPQWSEEDERVLQITKELK